MINRRILLFLFLFVTNLTVCYSQTVTPPAISYRVTGRVTEAQSGEPLDYASVAIYPASGGSALTGTLTTSTGSYILKNIPDGDYEVTIEFMGYQKVSQKVTVKGKSVYIGVSTLKPSAEMLSAVTVEGRAKERAVTVEKSRIDVSKSISSVSGNLLEIIKGDPAVTIDNEENLYIRGNKNVLILIDGKPTTLSSISAVPASGISHIEIITSPYVKYDAEGSGGIINIISKSNSSEGKSMMATLNGGYKNRINGGLGFSYNNGRLGVDLGYSGRYEKEHIVSDLTREILSPYENIVQDAVSDRKNNIHSFNLALSYAATSKNLIGINIKGLFPLLKTYQSITGSNPVSSVPAYRRLNDITFSRKNIEAAASFKHIFEKGVNELSFDAAFSGIKGSRPANYYIDDEFVQRSEGGGRPTSASVQADWLKVTGNGLKIETGAKFQSRWNNFEYRFYDRASGSSSWVLNNEFSNDLRHKENVYAAYLSVSGKFAEKWQYSYGTRAEYFTSDFDQLSTGENIYDERFSLFPFLSLKLGLGAENALSAIYNRRVTRPAYPQLNPYINQIDHITYESGNKWVRPELTDKAELSISLKKGKLSLNAGLYLSHTKDHIAQVTNVISANGTTSGNKLLITYVNVPHYYKPGIYIDGQLSSNGKFSISPSVSVYYNKFIDNAPGLAEFRENNLTLDASGFTATGSLRVNYYPDKKTDLQLFYSYISGQSLPRFNVDQYHTADIALKRKFFKGKITGTLSVSDIFNSKKWNISSINEIYRLTNNSKSDSRIVWLGLTLNLNSFKIKQPKGELQISEEGLIKLGY